MAIVGTGSGGGGGGGLTTLIETIDNSSTAGEFDFDSIASGYNRLIIKGYIRSDVTAGGLWYDIVNAYFNTDLTDGNYFFQQSGGTNGVYTVTQGATPRIGVVHSANATANHFATIEIKIENPDGAQFKNAVSTWGGNQILANGDSYVATLALESAVTDAITRVRIRTDNHDTDELFGVLRLYGEL